MHTHVVACAVVLSDSHCDLQYVLFSFSLVVLTLASNGTVSVGLSRDMEVASDAGLTRSLSLIYRHG